MRRIYSVLTMVALICGLSGGAALAQTTAAVRSEAASLSAGSEPEAAGRPAARAGISLKAEMLKLMAEARAGKVSQSTPPRPRPPQSNALTKGQKITIGVGVAVAVVVLAIILSRDNGSDRVVVPPCPAGQICL